METPVYRRVVSLHQPRDRRLEDHAPAALVNFWGAQWWSYNDMTGVVGPGVASFKGFATEADVICGGEWHSRPGNSSKPPDKLPPEIMVIVTDTIRKEGSDIYGRIKEIVIVKPDGSYGPSPGHRGNGTVVRPFCK